jgi:hypothetical protein
MVLMQQTPEWILRLAIASATIAVRPAFILFLRDTPAPYSPATGYLAVAQRAGCDQASGTLTHAIFELFQSTG